MDSAFYFLPGENFLSAHASFFPWTKVHMNRISNIPFQNYHILNIHSEKQRGFPLAW